MISVVFVFANVYIVPHFNLHGDSTVLKVAWTASFRLSMAHTL